MDHDALRRFSNSMNLSYGDWHDGNPYDLDALAALQGDDLRAAEDLVVARNLADWRDVQALDRIGSQRAIAEILKAVSSTNFEVRAEALVRLKIRGLLSDAQIEDALVGALRSVSLGNGLIRILGLANSFRSPAVRKAVLRTALDGGADDRCHAAACAHFIHGKSASMFDTAYRSLYLRFNSESRSERVEAFRLLCRLIEVDENALLAEFGRSRGLPSP